MFRRIIVTLDGSNFAEAALGPGLTMARASGAEVRLLAVEEPVPVLAHGHWDPAVAVWGGGYMKQVEETHGRDLPPGYSTRVLRGPPGPAIVEEAAGWGADLLVMATHGRGSFARALMGSVADHCVRHAPCPILLIPPGAAAGRSRSGLDVTHVVLALDGSELAEEAIGPAAFLAELLEVPVRLVRSVTHVQGALAPVIPNLLELSRDVLAEEWKAGLAYLDGVRDRLSRRGCQASSFLTTDPRVDAAIVREAEGGLIVLATHGRGGLGRALLGSVASAVISRAPGPVLVVRSTGG